jgi:hypothetical protein
MKIFNKIWGIGLLAFMLMLTAPHKTFAQEEGGYISDQEFYDELQPYGTWIYDQQYGNVWIPDVEEDFRPYATKGYWAMTSYGNTWVSDYPWGWATFHYGRWHFDNYYGWEWSPGSEWAPAWVTWRDGGGYYGWAPMEPGVSLEASYADNYSVADDYWVFAPYAYINYTNVYNYYVPHNRVRTIIRNTNWIHNRNTYNNYSYNSGPKLDEIQRYSHRPVKVYNINNVNRPSRITVNNNNINIYRPAVRQNANARPARVVDAAAYRQQNPAQRIGSNNRSRGTVYNAANAAKLAQVAKTSNPDSKLVRINSNANGRGNTPANTTRPVRQGNANPGNVNTPDRTSIPVTTGETQRQRAINNQRSGAAQQQNRVQQQQAREQQRQQTGQQTQQTEQQRQARQLQTEQQRQARQQQRTARPAVTDAQNQQQEQARQQAVQQRQQVLEQQRQQQQAGQRQTQQVREQQQQQAQQQRQQQQAQQQQQAKQVRDQQQQQAQQQRQQQVQQQQAQQQQQAKQVRDQQQQQAQQQRQQQAQQQQAQQQQQAKQVRDQQQQQAQQQRQQQVQQQQAQQQQRQQQAQQQRQQQQAQQQRQQQQPSAPSRRPVRE